MVNSSPTTTRSPEEAIPSEVLDLLRWLAGLCMLQQDKRWEALALSAEECKDFVSMRWPIVQGTRNQSALREIGRQPVSEGNLGKAVEWLLANPPVRREG